MYLLKTKPSVLLFAESNSAWSMEYAGKPMLIILLPPLLDLDS